MKLIVKRNLDDVLQLVMAAWLVISPVLLGYWSERAPTLTVVVVGAIFGFTAQMSIARPAKWLEYANLVLSIFLILSPYIIGFSENTVATVNTIIGGLVLGVLAIRGIVLQRRLEREGRDRDRHSHGTAA